jgi:dihydroxyacid dehydratase/phosphogluconate dehydratase
MADCIETGHYAHHAQAMIVISGCDKSGAAALMPLARTNAFGLVVYPGTSSPGRVDFGPWAANGSLPETSLGTRPWSRVRSGAMLASAGAASARDCAVARAPGWTAHRPGRPTRRLT